MDKFSYLTNANAEYIDEIYRQYLEDPRSVHETWRFFFDGIELGEQSSPLDDNTGQLPDGQSLPNEVDSRMSSEAKVAELITLYRSLGRELAHINPLEDPAPSHPLLSLEKFGLTEGDLDREFTAGNLLGMGPAKLRDILDVLRKTYCGSIGVEYTHIHDSEMRGWLAREMESTLNRPKLDKDTKKMILRRLSESEGFEKFLHTRYVAQKRFSLEGSESLIPSLDCIIEEGAARGATQFVMGMAHRGRLNVLTHIFGKPHEQILTEFEGKYQADKTLGEGDVKYHMGYSHDLTTRNGESVHLSLASNPSHLEFVNPVVEGVARAKQVMVNDEEGNSVVPILIHGDAAFAGQGVVYETLNLSELEGYHTGGTVHIVVNNQVGFTTSPKDSRSTPYATDLAKMLQVPVFHVNGDDPEAVWHVSRIAMDFRQKFNKDVFIDLISYRRHGHNEGDEPSFTQPLLYKKIKGHPTTRKLYADQLVKESTITSEEAQRFVSDYTQLMTEAQQATREKAPKPIVSVFKDKWGGLRRAGEEDMLAEVETRISKEKLQAYGAKLNRTPEGFHGHPKLGRFLEARLNAIQNGEGLDWGNGEALAFASLLDEGHTVRLSGQDAERGTFSHRHSVLYDYESGKPYAPLNHISDGQAPYRVHNSHLSESGVLGFEYGWSLADPKSLVIWEAQFGDFANGAQVIIDQFITSSESKWQRMTGLVMLLPHGFEGQGPEHSSARLERFLQLCGKYNITVANFTTPAQLFHALRRQLKRDFRKPLVIMSPKSLLRHPEAISNLDDFSERNLQEVIDDPQIDESATKNVTRLLLCSGKVYFDLLKGKVEAGSSQTAIVRIEQLYPWHSQKIADVVNRYPNAEVFWVQEEPRNMGAWTFVYNIWAGGHENFAQLVGSRKISYIGREVAPTPAVGSSKIHATEQKNIVDRSLGLTSDKEDKK